MSDERFDALFAEHVGAWLDRAKIIFDRDSRALNRDRIQPGPTTLLSALREALKQPGAVG